MSMLSAVWSGMACGGLVGFLLGVPVWVFFVVPVVLAVAVWAVYRWAVSSRAEFDSRDGGRVVEPVSVGQPEESPSSLPFLSLTALRPFVAGLRATGAELQERAYAKLADLEDDDPLAVQYLMDYRVEMCDVAYWEGWGEAYLMFADWLEATAEELAGRWRQRSDGGDRLGV